jgi:hypothetical protein
MKSWKHGEKLEIYLVNIQKTMENHHYSWEKSLFLWPCSIAMLNYQRVSINNGDLANIDGDSTRKNEHFMGEKPSLEG